MLTGNFRGFDVELHEPGVAVVTFNQPERLNGMTQPIKRDLIEVLQQAQMNDAVRVVVITGSGRAFSAGDDVTGRAVDFGDAQALVRRYRPATRTRSARTKDCACCRRR